MLSPTLQAFVDAAQQVEGWDPGFAPEPLEPGPPWDYEALAQTEVARAESALDLGTGGGEVLARLLSQDAEGACCAVATEAWHVNAPVAAKHLGARAAVVRASSLDLPFRSASFDLILSRHEEIMPREVGRVLRPRGCFLTQQVIHDVWPELRTVFPELARFPDHFTNYQIGLSDAGLVVEDARDWRHRVRYREFGHLVYHLALAAPWMLPGFSLETHADALAQLETWSQRDGGIILTEGFTLICARMRDDDEDAKTKTKTKAKTKTKTKE
jgi:SAM-dependent methyltransferase